MVKIKTKIFVPIGLLLCLFLIFVLGKGSEDAMPCNVATQNKSNESRINPKLAKARPSKRFSVPRRVKLNVSVKGVILDQNNKPFPGASVSFIDKEKDCVVGKAVSNADGIFRADSIPIMPKLTLSVSGENVEATRVEFGMLQRIEGGTFGLPPIKVFRYYVLPFKLKIHNAILAVLKSFRCNRIVVSLFDEMRPRFPFRKPIAKTSKPLTGNFLKGEFRLRRLLPLRVLFWAPFSECRSPRPGSKLWEGAVRPLDESYPVLKASCDLDCVVVGAVFSQSNEPIDGASVKLSFLHKTHKGKTVYSNQKGLFLAYDRKFYSGKVIASATFGEFVSKALPVLSGVRNKIVIDLSKATSVIAFGEDGARIDCFYLSPCPQAKIGDTSTFPIYHRVNGIQYLKTSKVPRGSRWFLNTKEGQCRIVFPENITSRNSPYKIHFHGNEANCTLRVFFGKGRVGRGSHFLLKSMNPRPPGSWPLEYLFIVKGRELHCPNLMPGKYKYKIINNASGVQVEESSRVVLVASSTTTLNL